MDVEIIKYCNGTEYISGFGGDNYQEENIYNDNGISLLKTRFTFKSYPQNSDEFIKGLSIFDAIFSVGVNHVKELI